MDRNTFVIPTQALVQSYPATNARPLTLSSSLIRTASMRSARTNTQRQAFTAAPGPAALLGRPHRHCAGRRRDQWKHGPFAAGSRRPHLRARHVGHEGRGGRHGQRRRRLPRTAPRLCRQRTWRAWCTNASRASRRVGRRIVRPGVTAIGEASELNLKIASAAARRLRSRRRQERDSANPREGRQRGLRHKSRLSRG